MTRTKTKDEDLLGVLTLGSVIGNFVQLVKHQSLDDAHKSLQHNFKHLVGQMQILYREFQSLREMNGSLQKQISDYQAVVDRLKKENEKQRAEIESLSGKKTP